MEPRYGFPEAAGIVGRPSRTLRRWALGHKRVYKSRPIVDEPLITVDGAERAEYPLSFLNLLELRFLASYRDAASLPAIRRALDYAGRELNADRPLLQLEFAIQGRELFLRYAEQGGESYFVNASRKGQMAWPEAVTTLMRSLDYDDAERAAYRWWPLGKAHPVVLDTRLNGGRPSTAESGVRTQAIATRAERGWSPEAISEDVFATADEIRAALDFEHAA